MERKSNFDSLAQMITEGFASIEERFTSIAENFLSLEEKIDERFIRVEDRIGSLEKEVRLTNQHIDRIVMPTLDSHAGRIKDLELKVA